MKGFSDDCWQNPSLPALAKVSEEMDSKKKRNGLINSAPSETCEPNKTAAEKKQRTTSKQKGGCHHRLLQNGFVPPPKDTYSWDHGQVKSFGKKGNLLNRLYQAQIKGNDLTLKIVTQYAVFHNIDANTDIVFYYRGGGVD
jgi:hypothetical protein